MLEDEDKLVTINQFDWQLTNGDGGAVVCRCLPACECGCGRARLAAGWQFNRGSFRPPAIE